MDDTKKKDLLDYLGGQTNRCRTCDRRVPSVEDALCTMCHPETVFCQVCRKTPVTIDNRVCRECRERADLREELKKESDKAKIAGNFSKWYVYWAPWRSFVCRGCEYPVAQCFGHKLRDGELVPVIACCPNTTRCWLAADFWGHSNPEPMERLDRYAKLVLRL